MLPFWAQLIAIPGSLLVVFVAISVVSAIVNSSKYADHVKGFGVMVLIVATVLSMLYGLFIAEPIEYDPIDPRFHGEGEVRR